MKLSQLKCFKLPDMVLHKCNSSYSRGWGRRITWAREFKASQSNIVGSILKTKIKTTNKHTKTRLINFGQLISHPSLFKFPGQMGYIESWLGACPHSAASCWGAKGEGSSVPKSCFVGWVVVEMSFWYWLSSLGLFHLLPLSPGTLTGRSPTFVQFTNWQRR